MLVRWTSHRAMMWNPAVFTALRCKRWSANGYIDGQTLMYRAAVQNRVGVMRTLHKEFGADLARGYKDHPHETPLLGAVRAQQRGAVKWLLSQLDSAPSANVLQLAARLDDAVIFWWIANAMRAWGRWSPLRAAWVGVVVLPR